MQLRELKPLRDTQKSFYGKARVYFSGDTVKLISYNTCVASVDTTLHRVRIYGWYSTTTARHINEFLYQYVDARKLSKREMEAFSRQGTYIPYAALVSRNI